jgi:hypothetical protein
MLVTQTSTAPHSQSAQTQIPLAPVAFDPSQLAPAKAERDMRGSWRCETDVPLLENISLQIVTHKVSSGALVTSARGVIHERGMIVWRSQTDYFETLAQSTTRVTAPSCERQHAIAMEPIASLRTRALAHYTAGDRS